MTETELYSEYAKWTGLLHHWVLKQLGRHVDVEFFPAPEWTLRVYSGRAQDAVMTGWYGTTVPSLKRPQGEARATIELPRPEAEPTRADLDQKFREICLAIARVLEIDLGKPALPPNEPKKSKNTGKPRPQPRLVKGHTRRRPKPSP